MYYIQRQNNYVQISIQDYFKILQEKDLKIKPRTILRDMLQFSNFMKQKIER